MIVVNFDHPVTADHLASIVALTGGGPIGEVKEVRCQADLAGDFASQGAALVESVRMSPAEWQQLQYVVCLPGLAPLAAAVLASIHGRSGHFPAIVRRRPVAGAVPPRFEVAEIVGLQALRDASRLLR